MGETETNQSGNATGIKRVCQIVVAFQTDTDEEAMRVKGAIDAAVANLGDIQVTFTSRNFKNIMPMMRR